MFPLKHWCLFLILNSALFEVPYRYLKWFKSNYLVLKSPKSKSKMSSDTSVPHWYLSSKVNVSIIDSFHRFQSGKFPPRTKSTVQTRQVKLMGQVNFYGASLLLSRVPTALSLPKRWHWASLSLVHTDHHLRQVKEGIFGLCPCLLPPLKAALIRTHHRSPNRAEHHEAHMKRRGPKPLSQQRELTIEDPIFWHWILS